MLFWSIDPAWPAEGLTKAMGVFFLSSGYHKAFVPEVGDKMSAMFKRIGFGWALPLVIGGELLGGLALVLGFLVPVAALGLTVIMAGAICTVCWPEVVAKHPRDAMDWVAKAIYMPEGLMVLVLIVIAANGALVDHTDFWWPIIWSPVGALGVVIAATVVAAIQIITAPTHLSEDEKAAMREAALYAPFWL